MTKVQERQDAKTEALAKLDDMLGRCERYNGKPIVYFIIRSVAASGMSRVFSTYLGMRSEYGATSELVGIDRELCSAFGYTWTRDGYRIHGCGMDMRFAVCDDLAAIHNVPSVDTRVRRASGNDFDYRSL